MKAFTAKVKIGHIIPNGSDAKSVSMYPNYGSNGAVINKEWASASPGLSFQITMRNEIADRLEMGDEFTVTFKKDEKEEVKTDGIDTSA